jgi:hypothetical protein
MRTFRVLSVVMCAVLFGATHARCAIQLVNNGNFSAGVSGWTVSNWAGGSGNWFFDTVGTTTPFSDFQISGSNKSGAAAAGTYAVSDQLDPGAHALVQSFFVPGPAQSVILSFDMFVNSYGGHNVSPAGLDFNGQPNQHARVDLLLDGAGPFNTGPGVIQNFYTGIDTSAYNPNYFTHYSFDITSLVGGGGGTFQLRFAEVDNQNYFHMGVDNVSVLYHPVKPYGSGATPEPVSLIVWSMLLGLGACAAARRSPKYREDAPEQRPAE